MRYCVFRRTAQLMIKLTPDEIARIYRDGITQECVDAIDPLYELFKMVLADEISDEEIVSRVRGLAKTKTESVIEAEAESAGVA